MPEYPHRPRTREGQPPPERGPHADRSVTDDLLAAAGRGDLRAFAAFYDATAAMTFGLLHGVLRHRGRAELGTERVYLQLWRTAAAFEPTAGSARALLVATTLNELTGQVEEILTRKRAARGPDTPTDPVGTYIAPTRRVL